MSYLVIARKYRPQRFEEVIGQEHISSTLKNAIRLSKISHSYLFTGPRGVGKTTTARILAKAVNCPEIKNEEPCGKCRSCREITASSSMDVIEIDAASNRGIDDIRQLRENVKYAPASGKYKVYIIDEVHMLTKEAFNAILKTLEEPPPHAIFVMATTEPDKVPETISSRCQTFGFKLISEKKISDTLKDIAEKENVKYDVDALMMIARAARGSMRDAESLMDQALSYAGGILSSESVFEILGLIPSEFLFEYTEHIKNSAVKEALLITEKLEREGFGALRLFSELQSHFRNLMFASVFSEETGFMGFSNDYSKKLAMAAEGFTRERLIWIIDFLTMNARRIKYADDPRIVMDTVIFKLCQRFVSYDELIELIGSCSAHASDSEKNVEKLSPPVDKPVDKPEVSEYKIIHKKPSEKPVNNKKNEVSSPVKPASKGRWERILGLIEKDSVSFYHRMTDAEAKLEGKAVVIHWRSPLDISDSQKEILKKRIKEVMGDGHYPEIRRAVPEEQKNNQGDTPKKKTRRITPSEIEKAEPVVKKIVEIFDGRIEKD